MWFFIIYRIKGRCRRSKEPRMDKQIGCQMMIGGKTKGLMDYGQKNGWTD